MVRAMTAIDGTESRATTLRDVATRAGVSVSTASRTLNGGRPVSADLQARVRDSAVALGYRPNEAARNLRRSRTMTFGVVFGQFKNPVILDVLDGLGAGSEARGYSLMVTNANSTVDQYRLLIRRLFERRVDGIFVSGPVDVRPALEMFRSVNVPALALFTRGDDCADIPLLTASEDSGVDAAVRRLAELGHRTIAHFNAPGAELSRRPSSVQAAARDNGIELIAEYTSEEPTSEQMEAAISRVRARPNPATAIIVRYTNLPTLLRALGAIGLRVPDDLSVLTFTDSTITEGLTTPPIASIHTDTHELGRRAAELMANWIEGEEPPNVTDFDDLCSWVERASVGPPPAR